MENITITITKDQLSDLKSIRSYFGENDETTFEHNAYTVINNIITQCRVIQTSGTGENPNKK